MKRDMIPAKIKGFRSKPINGLIDCVQSLWPLMSATLMISMSAKGTKYEVKRPGAGGTSVNFPGEAWIAGNLTTGLDATPSKPYIRCFLDTATAEEHAGPMPNPWPPNESWREKKYLNGPIVIDRA